MGYGKRIDILCAHFTQTDSFADVGCDHGYCAEYVLSRGLSKRVIFSDVSKGSLAKAEKRLAPYVRQGLATPVLGDGFFGVPKEIGEVVIAGMGGSEIVHILSDEKHGFMPKRFIFQPMHDSERLRRYILANGGYIERDYTFQDGKFYDLIVGGRREEGGQVCDEYSDAAYEFGKENLRDMPKAFRLRTEKQIKNIEKYLSREGLQEGSKKELLLRKERLQGVLDGRVK